MGGEPLYKPLSGQHGYRHGPHDAGHAQPGYTGQRDADFLAMLILNHEGAVDMARLALIHGRDSVVRQIAEEIIASQRVDRRDARANGGFARGAESGAGRLSGCGGCAGWGLIARDAVTGRSWQMPGASRLVGLVQSHGLTASSPKS